MNKKTIKYPKISIVTPSYNQAKFLEETIRSVLLQNYPNLEYLIIDGGSSDGSVDIIKKYEPWLSYWVSEPDNGQSQAINKGFLKCTGKYVAWINSDDLLKPETLFKVANAAINSPEAVVLYGDCEIIDEKGQTLSVYKGRPFDLEEMLLVNGKTRSIAQPASFFKRSAFEQIGYLDENLHMIMDVDIYLRIAANFGIEAYKYLPETWACFRSYPSQKTYHMQPGYQHERLQVIKNIYQGPIKFDDFIECGIRRKALSWAYFMFGYGLVMQRKKISGFLNVIKSLVYDPLIIKRPKFCYRTKQILKSLIN